jgi:hypothetical protein
LLEDFLGGRDLYSRQSTTLAKCYLLTRDGQTYFTCLQAIGFLWYSSITNNMVLTDICILFSTVVWFLVTFISFYNFFISNQDFLQILKNLKFRKKKLLKATNTLIMLDSLNPLLKLNHKIVSAWVTLWSEQLISLISSGDDVRSINPLPSLINKFIHNRHLNTDMYSLWEKVSERRYNIIIPALEDIRKVVIECYVIAKSDFIDLENKINLLWANFFEKSLNKYVIEISCIYKDFYTHPLFTQANSIYILVESELYILRELTREAYRQAIEETRWEEEIWTLDWDGWYKAYNSNFQQVIGNSFGHHSVLYAYAKERMLNSTTVMQEQTEDSKKTT